MSDVAAEGQFVISNSDRAFIRNIHRRNQKHKNVRSCPSGHWRRIQPFPAQDAEVEVLDDHD